MKAIKSIFTLTILLLIQSCGDKGKTANKKADRDSNAIQSWEFYGKDTINRTDFAKNKQGHWEIRKFIACTKTVQAVYSGEPGVQTKISNDVDMVKLSEGIYVDNKKEGLWINFFPSGKVKDSVMYKNDVAVK